MLKIARNILDLSSDSIFRVMESLHMANQYSGTGIGLAIARRGVERLGGRHWPELGPELREQFLD